MLLTQGKGNEMPRATEERGLVSKLRNCVLEGKTNLFYWREKRIHSIGGKNEFILLERKTDLFYINPRMAEGTRGLPAYSRKKLICSINPRMAEEREATLALRVSCISSLLSKSLTVFALAFGFELKFEFGLKG